MSGYKNQKNFRELISKVSHALLQGRQKKYGIHQIQQSTQPNTYEKNWKALLLQQLSDSFFVKETCAISSEKVERYLFSGKKRHAHVVFLNGVFQDNLSTQMGALYQVKVVRNSQLQFIDKNMHIFEKLNLDTLQECTRISVCPSDQKTTLHLLYLKSGCKNMVNISSHHHDIFVGATQKVDIIESHVSLDNFTHLSINSLNFEVRENATILHTKLVTENKNSYHFGFNNILSNTKSQVNTNIVASNLMFFSQNIYSKMLYELSKLNINTLCFATHQNFCKINTFLEHKKNYQTGQQLHKVVLEKESTAVFEGKIKIQKDCKKIHSFMHNKNLVLQNASKVFAYPHLEIYSDDVKCSHDVTISQPNLDQIFYLQTRGICKKLANQILVYSFCVNVINNSPVSIHNKLKKILQNCCERLEY